MCGKTCHKTSLALKKQKKKPKQNEKKNIQEIMAKCSDDKNLEEKSFNDTRRSR